MIPANLLTNDSLREWLQKQPPDGEYDYINDCLIGRYLAAHGIDAVVGISMVWHEGGVQPLPDGWNRINREPPRTFGAALEVLNSGEF